MRGAVLHGLLFGPGHLDPPMVLGRGAGRLLALGSLPAVGVVVVVRPDAGQTQHGVAILHQLGLVR